MGAQLHNLDQLTAFGRRIDSPRRGMLAVPLGKDSSRGALLGSGYYQEIGVAKKFLRWIVAGFGALSLAVTPALANDIRSIDPSADPEVSRAVTTAPATTRDADLNSDLVATAAQSDPNMAPDTSTTAVEVATAQAPRGQTYHKDDLIGAAEGVFGKGAKGLAELVEKILKDQGEPNAYIAGREASGAFVVGLRYGSGTLSHTVEGQRAVYWTGPSLGFDVGGDAANTFVLVYNLYDSQDLYKRYPQVEGRAYFVGGLSATYLRRGDVAIIPIRLGVGLRLGANIGYMKFSEKSKWLPF
jgi:hypothetical protein